MCSTLFLNIAIIFVVFYVLVAVIYRKEIRATLERDPSARTAIEIILFYSGLHALILHSLAQGFYKFRIPVLPRAISQLARFLTGIEIHPGAQIGAGFFIDHGMGVVIGETSIIGKNVTIFQGVTLGGTGKEQGKRHPTIGDNVVIGAGAKVLGNITVGDNTRIGANAVVVRDVPPNSTVVGVPGRIARQEGKAYPGINLDHSALPDPIAERLEKLQHEIDFIEGELKKHK